MNSSSLLLTIVCALAVLEVSLSKLTSHTYRRIKCAWNYAASINQHLSFMSNIHYLNGWSVLFFIEIPKAFSVCSTRVLIPPSWIYQSKHPSTTYDLDIRPFLKAAPRKSLNRARKRRYTAVLTNTPIRKYFATEEEAKKSKKES